MTVYPADVVLFEGILAFYSQEVRDLFHMKLFVDTDADTRLSRRGACAEPAAPAFSEGSPGPARGGPAARTTGHVEKGRSLPPGGRERLRGSQR